jgi:hypothetical protein
MSLGAIRDGRNWLNGEVPANDRRWRNLRLQPKSAFPCFPLVDMANLEVCKGSRAVGRRTVFDRLKRAESEPTGVASGRTGV